MELNGWVGNIEIKIPEDMAVDLTANVNIGTIDLFGDETKFAKGKSGNTHFTSNTVSYRSDQYDSANKKVKIKASVNIGEISIERV
jgi:lia operon protein LiaF